MSRCWHPGLPRRISQFEHVPTGIQEVELSPREEATPAIDNWLGDGYALFMEELTCSLENLRAYLEGMVKAIILLGCPHDRLFAAAEQDRVTADREAGHGLVAEVALVLEPEHVPIELL